MRRCITVNPADNVTTVVDDETQAITRSDGGPVHAGVPYGHKIALRAIAPGVPVIKYGVPIGIATTSIAEGEHVHIHNVDELAK